VLPRTERMCRAAGRFNSGPSHQRENLKIQPAGAEIREMRTVWTTGSRKDGRGQAADSAANRGTGSAL